MPPDVLDALKKLIAPIAVLAIAVIIWRVRNLSLRDDLAVVAPRARDALLWIVVWVAWMALSEFVANKVGVEAPEIWSDRSVAAMGALFVGMVLLAPIGEELVFRGLLYGRLANTSLGPAGAVAVAAVVFGLLHIRYGWVLVAFVVVDGVWYGIARVTSGTVIIPMIMHVMGNLLAWYQHLPRNSGG